MTSLTTTIEINLRQLLGETNLPQPEVPVHGVLW
jgi:putative membrane protein